LSAEPEDPAVAASPGEILGANVRTLRNRRGLSQEELGAQADLHRTEISHLERASRDARLATIVKVARALRVAPRDLLRGIE
jgi:transcriptional regulator with XRE-family HTH domain